MSEGQGSISYSQGSAGGSGGGQPALVSTGAGVPVFIGPNSIQSIQEVSGVAVAEDSGAVGLTNRLLYFFPKQYGAKGDGVTDDTAAVQACFAAASAAAAGTAGAATVYFSEGTYILSGTLTSAQNLTILGAGENLGTTLKWSANIPGIVLSTTGCQIKNIFLWNTNAAPTSGCIGFNYAGFDLIMDSVLFEGWYNQCACTENTGSIFVNCAFFGWTNYGLYLTNTNPDQGDACLSNCIFESGTAGCVAGMWQDNSGGTKIVNCKVLGNGLMQYGFVCNITGSGTSDFYVANCSIETTTVAGIYVIETGSLMRFVSIVGGNVSSYDGGNGIVLTQSGGAFNGVSIVGVNVSFNNSGIVINNVTGVNLSGNTFFDNTTDVVRTGTTTVNFGLAGDNNATAPATTVGVLPTTVYGSLVSLLGAPTAWTAVVVNGVTYKMPLY